MSNYNSIKVKKGSGGFGGPLVITPTEKKNKFIYVVGGGEKPAIVDKIAELTGMEPVNGFKTSIPDDEIAAAIIDCGGTLRCGIYPKKGIPTINIMATGKSGPLRQFITEDIYVSNVDVNQVSVEGEVNETQSDVKIEEKTQEEESENAPVYSKDKKIMETRAEESNKSFLT